jgi:AAA+ ATPase superfamily predicted ATPase
LGSLALSKSFLDRVDAPAVFFTASNISAVQELANFGDAVATSDLPDKDLYAQDVGTWDAALRLLAQALPSDRASVVVIDELPYLTAHVDGLEGSLQTVWDRVMSHKPVLLLLVGSDMSIMKAIGAYDRPFHQRGKPVIIEPLAPADVQDMTQLPGAEAIDAYLVTGGMPLICREWGPGAGLRDFLEAALRSPATTLVSSAELSLAAEFPPEAHARLILPAIASGERSFTPILQKTGMNRMTFTRALDVLADKGIIVAERPLSTRPSKETRYRITDSYMRFWLRFLLPQLGEIGRGRGDRTLRRVEAGWTSWRGRAIEPVVREALSRLLPDDRTPWLSLDDTTAIGGYWTRSNDVEVDLVAADREPVAQRIGFVGSITWHENAPFEHRQLLELAAARDRIPGTTSETPLVAVSRVPSDVVGADAVFNAEELLQAWR